MIKEHLIEAGFDVVDEGLRHLWNPGEDGIAQCRQYGRDFAAATSG